MAVKAIKEFVGVPKDIEANFHGNRLIYIGWDKHLMFYAPLCVALPPSMPFQQLIEDVIPNAWGSHPDLEKVEWEKVEWMRSGQAFTPEFSKSLEENGVRHKDILRMRTPGLDGINGTCF